MFYAFVLVLVVAALGALLYVRSHGLVYVGRTQGGWTTVHDDTRVIGERIRVLEVSGTYQSATFLDERWCEPVFPYHLLFDHVFDGWPTGDGPSTVAILGGGGYALPKHFVAHHPEVERIDVIELDPAIERIARRYFFLNRLEDRYGAERSGRLNLHQGDARRWLELTGRRFDAILNDCFLANEPEATLMTVEGAKLVRTHLAEGGVYLTNVVSALDGIGSSVLYQALDALGQAFTFVWVYPCGTETPLSRENNMVIASDRKLDLSGAWEWPTNQGVRS